MNSIGFSVLPLVILAVYSAALFAVIYSAVRLAIRHERRQP
jgi:hypothetical protein